MKRHLLPITVLILSLALAGCLTVFVPVDTPTPPPTPLPLPTSIPSVTPIQSVAPTETQSQTAQLCAVDPLVTSCAVPKVDERDRYCFEKLPYTQFATAPGVTFEPVEPGLKCADQGIRGGEQVIACTGQPLTAYTMKVCNAACTSNTALTVDATKCSEGYGYSAEANCCWPIPKDDAGCTLVKVDITACR